MEATTAREANGSESPLPTYEHRLMCSEDGKFPAKLGSSWEVKVLKTEMQRQGFQAWYSNPSRSSQDSLGVSYTDNNQVKIVRPDFIFFSTQPDGSIAADIVDPTALSSAMHSQIFRA